MLAGAALHLIRPRTIGTLAGTGEPGYAGDSGPATAARLNEPKSLALDGRGHLYIADAENHVIRRVDLKTGLIVTVAGRPPEADEGISRPIEVVPASGKDDDPLADPPPMPQGRVAQLADLSGTVRFVVGSAAGGRFHGDGGPAVDAVLHFPSAVVVDGEGHLYIADTMNHRVRRVDAATAVITTVAGTGQRRCSGDGGPGTAAALNEPAALALDGRGGLYIADQSNNRVRRLDLATGIITTVAGTGEAAYSGDGGPAAAAALAGPSGLAVGLDGALYIADTFNGRIRKVEPGTGVISTVAGDGSEYRYQGRPGEFSTSVSRPYGIAVEPAGHVLLTDSDSHLIRRWDCRKRIITVVAGNGLARFAGDGGPPGESSLNYPFGVAVDIAGNIYIADTFNHRIRMIAA
ncbi:NHL domain-containing protein [Nitrospira sp. Kam-Ns4a]